MTHLLISYQNINAKNVIPPPYRNFAVHSIFIEKQYPKCFLTLDVMQLAKTVWLQNKNYIINGAIFRKIPVNIMYMVVNVHT